MRRGGSYVKKPRDKEAELVAETKRHPKGDRAREKGGRPVGENPAEKAAAAEPKKE